MYEVFELTLKAFRKFFFSIIPCVEEQVDLHSPKEYTLHYKQHSFSMDGTLRRNVNNLVL